MSMLPVCYGEEGERIHQLCELSWKHNQTPSTLLLKGDSGIGKTYIIDYIGRHYHIPIQSIVLGNVAIEYKGHLDKVFQNILWNKKKKQLVLIEDIDFFFPKEGQSIDIISSFNLLFHTIHQQQWPVMIVATTRQPDNVLSSIRRLFQDEITLQIPTPLERYHIMKHLLESHGQMLKDQDILNLSSRAHAHMAADLARWYRLAEKKAVSEQCKQITLDHFMACVDSIRLTGMKESLMAEKPDRIYWSDIGGLKDVKSVLEESAVWIYKHSDAYKRLGIRPSKGLLLYGPPGTGKTMLAKAVATESSANFLAVRIPDLIKGEVGESEKAVSRIFQTAIRCSPCVIFLDELEAVFASRESSGDVGRKLISQFLIEIDHLDKIDQSVILLGATNHPESIDESILRPGRLDKLVYVGAPNQEERVQILDVLKHKTRLHPEVDLSTIASLSHGYTGADLKAVMRKAGLLALKKNAVMITQEDIEMALHSVPPSVIE